MLRSKPFKILGRRKRRNSLKTRNTRSSLFAFCRLASPGYEKIDWKETIRLQKFLQQYELVHRGKNLVLERKIKLVNCTFYEWHRSEEDKLWIRHWNGSLCYADGLNKLKGKDLQHWEVYKANYLHFGHPNYQLDGTNNKGTTQLRCINKNDIAINYTYFN